jgi:hypothetical protein
MKGRLEGHSKTKSAFADTPNTKTTADPQSSALRDRSHANRGHLQGCGSTGSILDPANPLLKVIGIAGDFNDDYGRYLRDVAAAP